NTDQPLLATEHRQPPDLDVAHVRRDLVEILVVIAYLTSAVMTSPTLESGPRPKATPRMAISRSEIIPIRHSLSVTGSKPTPSAAIASAASFNVSSGV